MNRKRSYDFIIVGSGIAGLTLAYRLLLSPLNQHSILLIDRKLKNENDRTLCYWTNPDPGGSACRTPFDSLVHRSWNQLRFASEKFDKIFPLGNYRYQMIRSIDFYQFVQQALKTHSNFTFQQAEVEWIEDDDVHALVYTDRESIQGKWVFDSRFIRSELQPDPTRNYLFYQRFLGWLIETPERVFDPAVPTLLDFRGSEQRRFSFFYLLPFTAHRALVESVMLDEGNTPTEAYSQRDALQRHIGEILGIRAYSIAAEEGGISPLTDCPFPRRVGRRIMTIGTPGGQIKPTTGYAFTRIQRDSTAIIRSLLSASHPFDVPTATAFYRLCDSLMLHVMSRHSEQTEAIFTTLFRNNPIGRILRFLDEAAAPWENLALMASLPASTFLRALFQTKLLHRYQSH